MPPSQAAVGNLHLRQYQISGSNNSIALANHHDDDDGDGSIAASNKGDAIANAHENIRTISGVISNPSKKQQLIQNLQETIEE